MVEENFFMKNYKKKQKIDQLYVFFDVEVKGHFYFGTSF